MLNSGRGEPKALSTASNGQSGKKKGNKDKKKDSFDLSLDHDVSYDLDKNENVRNLHDLQKVMEDKIKDMEDKMKNMETTHQAKLDTLYKVLEQKDTIIGRLNVDIGELKRSCSYLTNETAELKKLMTDNNKSLDTKIKSTEGNIDLVKAKTVDLEDRSRRCNLVFYNFKEATNNENEDCEKLILHLLDYLKIFDKEETIWIERAHRLGKKDRENNKPRPIIVCFSYFKQKQEIIKNGARFRDCPINVSEDFSRETLDEHKKLRTHGDKAKQAYVNETKSIKHYKVSYRRLVVTYSVKRPNQIPTSFVKSFTLNDITRNPDKWFVPLEEAHAGGNR